MGPNSKAGDEGDTKKLREQARQGNSHTYTPTNTHTYIQSHCSNHIATEVQLWKANKGAFVLLCVCAAESESSAVPMMEEMSLLQEAVEQNRAAEASSFIEPSFIHTEPPEFNVRNVHTLKLSSPSKHINRSCVWYKFC